MEDRLPNQPSTTLSSWNQSTKKSKKEIYHECANMAHTSHTSASAESPFEPINRATPIQHDHGQSKKFSSPYSEIFDKFTSLEDVTSAIRKAGLESCSLIIGIDFTKSNLQHGHNLHHLDKRNHNPYQRVISILGETLESFDDDRLIPAFGFGDVKTKDFGVFPFLPKGFCEGFQEVLSAYKGVAGSLLGGPTNFAPLIYKAIHIVMRTRSYHILVIVSDGQVTSEQATRNAIVEASRWPLSIILVGVGDGPWAKMQEYENSLPTRKFDNFQFVEFENVMLTYRFASLALIKIPDQYKDIKKLGILNFSDNQLCPCCERL